jgi:CRISPR/Cas system Type II protein with McrA/HNH and RuvC-like nuclease domain
MEDDNEKVSLSKKLDMVIEAIDKGGIQKEKQKTFKLPFMIRFLSYPKIKKQNKILILMIKSNGSASFLWKKIEDNCVKIGEFFYDATAGHILRYKRFPLLILTEWNMIPISPENAKKRVAEPFDKGVNFNEAASEGTLTAAQKVIITKLHSDIIKPKMEFNFKAIILVIVLLVGGYYALSYFKVI